MKTKLFLFLCFLVINAHAQEWQRELDSVLENLSKNDLFDGQILIAENGKIQYHSAFGEMETSAERPIITKQQPFKVYSVGKSMTAAAILMLVEQGRIQLNDPLEKFFPETPYKKVTVEHLLTMTSGLPRFLPIALTHGDTTKIMSTSSLLELVWEKNPEAGVPGESFFYNNANYTLLAAIVEKVSGQEFGEYLEENIFVPAGMSNSYEGTARKIPQLKGDQSNSGNFLQTSGAGGVYTTAEDLFKYDRALKKNVFFSQQLKEKVFSPYLLKNGESSDYGYGWRISEGENGREVYHVGDGVGMRASLQRFIDEDKTLIYIHAFSNEYHEPVYWAVRNIWEGKAYRLPIKRKPIELDEEELEKYVGVYEGTNFGKVHVSLSEGKLFLRPDPIPGKEELVPMSKKVFYFKGQNLEWEFYFDSEGNVTGFGIKGNESMKGKKL